MIQVDTYYYSIQKRVFDLVLSLILLIFLFPLFLIIAVCIVLDDGYPVIFKQKRMGDHKKNFTIFKFRTMKKGSEKKQASLKKINQAPYPMFKIEDDPRFTNLGSLLSNLGIDELPQIINILKGEMSFIGPRPLPTYESKKLDETWDFRYSVKPGIISEWALNKDRYKSLKKWKDLEINSIKNGSSINDIQLVYSAFVKVTLKKLIQKIVV